MKGKYKVLVTLLIVIGVLTIKVFADNSLTAGYSFVISAPTTTTLTLAWSDSNDVAADSLAIMHLSGADSLHISYVGEASDDTTLITRAPGTQYILYIKRLRGDSCVISNKDTMTTAWPELENRRTAGSFQEMWGAKSWSPSDISYDSLYVSTATGLDSTMAYWAAEYTGIQAKAIDGVGGVDSCKVNLLVFYGHMRESNIANYKLSTGGFSDLDSYWNFKNAAKDSIVITEAGWTIPKQLVTPPSQHFYIRADGQTDNAFATKILLRLFRFGEIAE